MRILTVIIALLAASATLFADEVHLKGGNVVEGKVSEKDGTIEVRLLKGKLSFPAEQVEKIVTKRCVVDEYDDFQKTLNRDSIESLLNFAGWCTIHNLPKETRETFQRVLELDAENEIARSKLGYRKKDGAWISDKDLLRERGLVEYQGRIIAQEELDHLREAARLEEQRKTIQAEIRALMKQFDSDESAVRERAGVAIRYYAPEDRLPLLQDAAASKNEQLRLYAVRELGAHPDPESSRILAKIAIRENDDLRKAALDGLQRIGVGPAVETFREALKSRSYNRRIRAVEAAKSLRIPETIADLVRNLDETGRILDNVIPAGAIPVEIQELFVIMPDGDIEVVPHVVTSMPKFDKTAIEAHAGAEINKILAALNDLTGANFGRNIDAWKQWMRNNPPIGARKPQ